MEEHAVMCPQCNAPLSPHRFATSTVCAYCGATVRLEESSVSASKFHKAFRTWNAPEDHSFSSWISAGNRHWAIEKQVAQGDISDVYIGRLARWPTELVIIKVLRDHQDAEHFDNEWETLQVLHKSSAPGADTFTMLIPQPVVHGNITAGSFTGRRVSIFRRTSGFQHTFSDVILAYPGGIPPQASIWVWRRILEVLSFIHASGMVHGAVIPAHLLVHQREHSVLMVGYSAAGRFNEVLRTAGSGNTSFYPQGAAYWSTLTAQLDLVMSARCMTAILGGNPKTASLPKAVPEPLARIVQRIAQSSPDEAAKENAWALREELGQIADRVFGAPQYIPIIMPD